MTSVSPSHFATECPYHAGPRLDRKSTRLNSSHSQISYAVFCLKKKNEHRHDGVPERRARDVAIAARKAAAALAADTLPYCDARQRRGTPPPGACPSARRDVLIR